MKTPKNWEVGSTWFPTDSEDLQQDVMCSLSGNTDVTFLSTCRSGITAILDTLPTGSTAIVPEFTCHSVVQPFIQRGYEVIGYPVNSNLQIEWEYIRTLAEKYNPAVILIHGYFGFEYSAGAAPYIRELRQKGCIIIDDFTQNMFSDIERIRSDYFVGSIRKWLPIPDGAFISRLTFDSLAEDKALADAKISAMRAKYRYIFEGTGDKPNFMNLFKVAEDLLDSRKVPFAMSAYSRYVISRLDKSKFCQTRRENYSYLAQRLARHHEIEVIHPDLSSTETPFMLPVMVRHKRSELQKYLAQRGVYPTIIWKCPDELEGIISPLSKSIYDNILCFHVDQRYDLDDMKKVADITDSYFQ